MRLPAPRPRPPGALHAQRGDEEHGSGARSSRMVGCQGGRSGRAETSTRSMGGSAPQHQHQLEALRRSRARGSARATGSVSTRAVDLDQHRRVPGQVAQPAAGRPPPAFERVYRGRGLRHAPPRSRETRSASAAVRCRRAAPAAPGGCCGRPRPATAAKPACAQAGSRRRVYRVTSSWHRSSAGAARSSVESAAPRSSCERIRHHQRRGTAMNATPARRSPRRRSASRCSSPRARAPGSSTATPSARAGRPTARTSWATPSATCSSTRATAARCWPPPDRPPRADDLPSTNLG